TFHFSSAILRAGNFLSIVCLFFGIAAAFLPGSPEQRIGSLFLFGLIPAVAFHAGGIVVGRLLAFSSELCDMLAVLCFQWLARLVKKYLTLATKCVSSESARFLMVVPARTVVWKVSRLSAKACRSIRLGCRHADRAIIEFSCLLIRSGARFILRMQDSRKMSRR